MAKNYFGAVYVYGDLLTACKESLHEVLTKLEGVPIDNEESFLFGVLDLKTMDLVKVGSYFKSQKEVVRKKLIDTYYQSSQSF